MNKSKTFPIFQCPQREFFPKFYKIQLRQPFRHISYQPVSLIYWIRQKRTHICLPMILTWLCFGRQYQRRLELRFCWFLRLCTACEYGQTLLEYILEQIRDSCQYFAGEYVLQACVDITGSLDLLRVIETFFTSRLFFSVFAIDAVL